MSIPKIKSCAVTLSFSTEDGFRSESSFTSKRSGDPGKCLVAVADEIARIAELHGAGDDVEAAMKEARERVREYRRAKPNGEEA